MTTVTPTIPAISENTENTDIALVPTESPMAVATLPVLPTPLLQLQQWMENPMIRQILAIVGMSLGVAIGVAVVLWSQAPSYGILYGELGQKDIQEVMNVLQQASIPYRIDEHSGALMVPSSEVQKTKIKLAGLGLPKQQENAGFEMLQKEASFGASRTIEAARYQRALEGELATTIASISGIDSARVHLAMPKKSAFVRPDNFPSASVMVKVHPGRMLDKDEVEAIVHLIASSVPELTASRVTVVDQKGRLLSGDDKPGEVKLSTKQLEYTRNLENQFKRRVEDILSPILGSDSLRAEVTADVDFTVTEQTHESYNPDQPALRSEQTNENQSRLDPVQGVPGALTNQPPAAGFSPEKAIGSGQGADKQAMNSSRQATRNYEVDRTMSHSRMATGQLKRLSVAVVIDDRLLPGASGQAIQRFPRSEEEITRITSLVRDTVGYNAERGDSVRVINAAFQGNPVEMIPDPPLWKQPWVWDLARQLGALLLVLVLILGVLRPTMKRLTAVPGEEDKAAAEAQAEADADAQAEAQAEGEGAEGEGLGEGENDVEGELAGRTRGESEGLPQLESEEIIKLPGPGDFNKTLDAVRQLVDDDPKRVAQVIKKWLAEAA
ncbi:MAG: flagellar basal-body MS-ring/collar protein FliF [Pseudomonadota bacterium]